MLALQRDIGANGATCVSVGAPFTLGSLAQPFDEPNASFGQMSKSSIRAGISPRRPSAPLRGDEEHRSLATPGALRRMNRAIVLRLIKELQPISRAALARALGVHRSSLTNIVRQLLEQDEIEETRVAPNGPGRPPLVLRIVSQTAPKRKVNGLNGVER